MLPIQYKPDTRPEIPASPSLRLSPNLSLFQPTGEVYRSPPRTFPSPNLTDSQLPKSVKISGSGTCMNDRSSTHTPPLTPRLSYRADNTIPHSKLFPAKSETPRLMCDLLLTFKTNAFMWFKNLFGPKQNFNQ